MTHLPTSSTGATLAFEAQGQSAAETAHHTNNASQMHREHAHPEFGSSGQYAPLHMESRAVVPTDCAAFHLNRRPQTLRCWAMRQPEDMPRPIRVNGRLAWRVDDLRRVLGVMA